MIQLKKISVFISTVAVLLCACSNPYSVQVNNQLVYDPPGLFDGYSVIDPELKKCVAATIAESGLTEAEQLTHLFCPSGKIQSLEGLQIFTNLQQIGVAQNGIRDLSSLSKLLHIQHADFSNNHIADVSHLATHKSLKYLDIRGNSKLSCDSINTLQQKGKITIKVPDHCQEMV